MPDSLLPMTKMKKSEVFKIFETNKQKKKALIFAPAVASIHPWAMAVDNQRGEKRLYLIKRQQKLK